MPQNPFGTPDDRGLVLEGVNPFAGISKDYVDTPFPEEPAAAAAPPAAASMPAFGPSPARPMSFLPRPQAAEPNAMSKMMPLFAAMLAGGKNPAAVGAGLVGFLQGKRLRERERNDARLQQQKEQAEAAEFYSRALANAGQFDDPIDFEQWKAAIAPMAQYHGIPLESFTFSDKRRAEKTKKDAAALLAQLDAKYPDGKYTAEWQGRRIPRAELAQIAGQAAFGMNDGQPLTPSKVPTPRQTPAVGSFEDYVARRFGETPTHEQITQARKDYQQADDRPRVTVNTGASEARTNARVDRIVASFNSQPIVREFNEVQAQHGIIQQVVNGAWSGPGDMAAVFAFMKALDPTSVVRETEYSNAAKSGNIFMGWAAKFNGALNPNGGFLSEQVRRDFLRTIDSRLAIKTKQYQNLRKQLVARVDRIKAGAPETGDEALIDYGSAMQDKPTTGTGGDVTSALAELERRRRARKGAK